MALVTEGAVAELQCCEGDFRCVAFTVRKEALTGKAEGGCSEEKKAGPPNGSGDLSLTNNGNCGS